MLDERVRSALTAETRFGDIRLLQETESTNQVVADLAAEGAPEGLVVVADVQTRGRGRLDRTWEAEPGAGLLVSVLLRPQGLDPQRWHLLTAAAGLAGQAACLEISGVGPDLKWPNDLLIGERKLAGILAEVPSPGPTGSPAVVVGMGLNVHSGPPGAAVLDQAAGRRIGRAALLVAWLRSLDSLLGRWDAVADAYREHCATVGRFVRVEGVAGVYTEGQAVGVDDHGRLLIRIASGDTSAISVGDVTHLHSAR